MSLSVWLRSLPPCDDNAPDKMAQIARREAAILLAVERGQARFAWVPLTIREGGHVLVVQIMPDALRIDGVRVNVSAQLEQRIADRLGASLLTPKLADRLYLARACTILPQPGPVTSSTQGMIDRSLAVDAAIRAAGCRGGIIQTVGKHWVLGNELRAYTPGTKAENYGWHGWNFDTSVTPGVQVAQGPGWAHPPQHVDASQTCVLVRNDCHLDGKATTIQRVLSDPATALLLSHEGVVTVLRQPGVDPLPPLSLLARSANGAKRNAASLTGAAIGGTIGGPVGVAVGAGVGAILDWWRAK